MNERGERIHQRVWDLLPWYVNGTLEQDEHRRVEEHLAGCPRCREEVDRSRGLARLVREAVEVAPSPHPVQLQRLLARTANEAEAEVSGPKRLRRTGAGWLRWLAAAQAAALLALLALLLARPAAPPQLYRTLSTEPAPAAAGAAARIRLLFDPATPEHDIRSLLAGIAGQIAGGPSPLGVYTVEVPTGPAADPLPVVLAHLRSHPAVRFAEPAADAVPSGAAR